MKVHETTGEEIELFSFGDFMDLKIVTEDRVIIGDIVFLFRNIVKVDTMAREEVNKIFRYFKK